MSDDIITGNGEDWLPSYADAYESDISESARTEGKKSAAYGDDDKNACFGPETAKVGDVLKEYIKDEIEDAQYYRILAFRAKSRREREIFAAASKDETRHAKKLSTAYFIATGKRYWPKSDLPDLRVPPLRLALRERFAEERAAAAKYEAAAKKTADRCLKEMLEDISLDERRHASEMIKMLEDMD